jgi:hypothetical protein
MISVTLQSASSLERDSGEAFEVLGAGVHRDANGFQSGNAKERFNPRRAEENPPARDLSHELDLTDRKGKPLGFSIRELAFHLSRGLHGESVCALGGNQGIVGSRIHEKQRRVRLLRKARIAYGHGDVREAHSFARIVEAAGRDVNANMEGFTHPDQPSGCGEKISARAPADVGSSITRVNVTRVVATGYQTS